jgi:hypothetical protein
VGERVTEIRGRMAVVNNEAPAPGGKGSPMVRDTSLGQNTGEGPQRAMRGMCHDEREAK